MNTEVLRERLSAFQIDSPDAAVPFTQRLARENHWTREFTLRAVEEYKRFAFLAAAAGHPVSPSDAVDQVWHLHLCYTQNYWKVFCKQVLEMPLHHMPGQGGDRAKFDEWYARTVASYERFFGHAPPADIWPAPEAKQVEQHDFQRVDRLRNWVIPKPNVNACRRAAAVVSAVVSALLCSGAVATADANVFDWAGWVFLIFYVVAAALAILLSLIIRHCLRLPRPDSPLTIPALDPYSIAFLNQGRILAVNTVLANLIRQQAVQFDPKKKHTIRRSAEPREPEHELERRIYSAIGPGGSQVGEIRKYAKPWVEQIRQNLKAHKLLMPNETARNASFFSLLPIFAVLAIGCGKIAVGLNRGAPVVFLVILSILLAVCTLLAFVHRNVRSRYGDAVLRRLKKEHHGRRKLERSTAGIPGAEFALLMGLFGMNALAGTDLQHLKTALRSPNGDTSASACGGGCGGGGHGDGGGGCGGCGGGGD